jgi:hypothetical protein
MTDGGKVNAALWLFPDQNCIQMAHADFCVLVDQAVAQCDQAAIWLGFGLSGLRHFDMQR